jgi:alpha-L-fucosidase
VGHNSVLLLNVPPDRRGLIAPPDVDRLREFHAYRERAFAVDLARGKPATASSSRPGAEPKHAVDGIPGTFWSPERDGSHSWLEVDLGSPTHFNVIRTQEQIAEGQRVEQYRVEALTGQGWKEVARGTTIGHKKLDRIPVTEASRLRLRIEQSRDVPLIRAVGLYRAL